MLATSPGGRGGANVLELATKTAPFFGADLRGSFSLPSFNDHFEGGAIKTPDIQVALAPGLDGLLP